MTAKRNVLDPLLDRMIADGFTELHLAAGFVPNVIDRGTTKDLNTDAVTGPILANVLIEVINANDWDAMMTAITRGDDLVINTTLTHRNKTLEVTVIAEGDSEFNVTFRDLEQTPS